MKILCIYYGRVLLTIKLLSLNNLLLIRSNLTGCNLILYGLVDIPCWVRHSLYPVSKYIRLYCHNKSGKSIVVLCKIISMSTVWNEISIDNKYESVYNLWLKFISIHQFHFGPGDSVSYFVAIFESGDWKFFLFNLRYEMVGTEIFLLRNCHQYTLMNWILCTVNSDILSNKQICTNLINWL